MGRPPEAARGRRVLSAEAAGAGGARAGSGRRSALAGGEAGVAASRSRTGWHSSLGGDCEKFQRERRRHTEREVQQERESERERERDGGRTKGPAQSAAVNLEAHNYELELLSSLARVVGPSQSFMSLLALRAECAPCPFCDRSWTAHALHPDDAYVAGHGHP